MPDYRDLYSTLAEHLPDAVVQEELIGEYWACARCADHLGLAMATAGQTIPPRYPSGLVGQPLSAAGEALMSWNLQEASLALAAANAALNRPERVEELGVYLPYERHYTDDLDFRGKTVGLIGHLRGSKRMRQEAKALCTLERSPQPGDYPDSACEYLLEGCDIVIITGSSLINKTLPRLLALTQHAYTILTGPSVPLCPALLDYGIDRLAGLAVTDAAGLQAHVAENRPGSPYPYGIPFVISK